MDKRSRVESSQVINLYKDFTLKARLLNRSEIQNTLTGLGATYAGEDRQTDHYYKVEWGKLKWRQGDIENLITHYEREFENGLERTIVYRYDINPSLAVIEELQRSHSEIGIVKKSRAIYYLQNIKIHLDELPNGEQFIEIEAIDRNDTCTHDELRQQCLVLKSRLAIPDHLLMHTGYLKA